MNTPVIILSGITPAELRALIREEVRLAVKDALDATRAPQMTTRDLEALLQKSGPALRTWLCRHPDFPRQRVGRRLLFDREAVRCWLEARHR